MLKIGSTGFDPDFLATLGKLNAQENFNLAEWLDAFPTDGEAVIPALAVDNPLTGLSLQLDGDVLDTLFAEEDAAADGADPGDPIGLGFDSVISHDGSDLGISSIAAAGDFESGELVFFATQVSADATTGFRVDDMPINAIPFGAESAPGADGAPGDSGLILLDFAASAKGGIPGPNGGGGGGGAARTPTCCRVISAAMSAVTISKSTSRGAGRRNCRRLS